MTDDATPPRRRLISPRLSLWLAVATGAAFGVAGLSVWRGVQIGRPDPRVASLCRSIIPALNPEGARFTIATPRRGAFEDSVRIAYIAELDGGRVRAREVSCQFEPSANEAAPARLVGVATERGPLSDANFYFLRRFYLETADGPPRDPAASQANAP